MELFVRNVAGEPHRVAIVSFNASAQSLAGLTDDRAVLLAAIDALALVPGTRIDLGLRATEDLFAREARAGANRVAVLLTDGGQTGGDRESVLAAAGDLKRRGATVYTIGLGATADHDLLQSVARSPGDSFPSPSGTELAGIYQAIALSVTCR